MRETGTIENDGNGLSSLQWKWATHEITAGSTKEHMVSNCKRMRTSGSMSQKLVLLTFTPSPGPKDTFFIAFTDETSRKETYGAARYLEVPFVPDGSIICWIAVSTSSLVYCLLGSSPVSLCCSLPLSS